MEPTDRPDVRGRDTFARGRLTTVATQAARDQARLEASQQAVASEVIAFQVVQQRAQLASSAEIDPARVAASLSAREREVVGLVAAGRTDGEIASELFISKKTASVHVANIKSKLGASSRVEIALLAAKLRLVPDGAAGSDRASFDAERTGPAVVCPFKGLASFDVGDGGYFFGRERVIAELIARLAATTFLAVVGPSGSGKSSVVKAGLAPALAAGVLPGSDEWPLAVLRPGDHPLDALGRALRATMRDADPVGDEHPVEEWLDRLPTGGRLVVIVDQLEEAFILCQDAQERAGFLDRLAVLANDAGRRALVVVAMRSEFYGRCAEHRQIAALASTSTVLLGPMNADELTRVIELPARAAGLRLDSQLAPALVTDVLQQPGGLPMLSSTLLELWQRREGRSLRMETFRTLGGISGAVGRVAEAAYGRLSPEDQAIARSIFLRLATVGENGIASRRRVPVGEIDAGRSSDLARVMAVLVDGRLLTVDDGYVEPAHEALLREWPRMRGWLEDDSQARRIREHLVASAREWSGTGREASELYRGQRLAVALEWASAHEEDLNDVEHAFLDASRQASEADLARQRRINVRLRGLLGAAAVLLVVAVVAGAVAVRQANVAQASADYARVRELGASSRIADFADASLGRLLAVAAADLLPPDIDTEAVLHEAWLADAVLQRRPMPAGRPPGLVANVDAAGTKMAEVWGHEGDGPSELEVVDLATGRTDWTYQSPTPAAVIDQAFFSLDGSQVVTSLMWVDEDHDPPAGELGILVFDAATGTPIKKIDVGPCGTLLTGVSAAGYLVVEPSDDGAPTCYAGDNPAYEGDVGRAVALVDPTTGTARTVAEDNLGDVMVSRDGRVLAYSSTDEFAVLVDLTTGVERVRVDAPAAYPQLSGLFRAISADGALALFGDRPQMVLDTATGKAIASLRAGEGENWGQAFAPVGDLAFTSGRDAVLRAWDTDTGAQLFAVPGVAGGTVLATLDGRALVVDEHGTITVTDPRARGEAAEFRTCRGFYPAGSLEIVGKRGFLAGACDAGGQPLYAIDLTGAPKEDWRVGGMDGQHFALSTDGTRIARELDETLGVEIVDATTGRQIRLLDGTCTFDASHYSLNDRWRSPGCRRFPTAPFPFWAVDLQFAPDGSLLVGLDDAGYLVAWDTATGRIVAAIDPGGWAGVLFRPDGRELIVGTRHGAILVYSTATWELLREVPVGESLGGSLSPVGFVDGGRTLLVAGGIRDEIGASVHRLDAASFEVLGTVYPHTANLKAVAASPEGTQVATAAADGSVRVWDAGTLMLEHELRVPGQAQGVAFVDETHLAVTPQAGDVLVMILDRNELLAKVRSTLTRGFTADECTQFGFESACPTLEEMRGGTPSP